MKRLLLLIGILILNILLINYLYNDVLVKKKFIDVINNNEFMLQALGSIDDDVYTNSIDALELNYKNGARIYEVDISLTSDDVLVLASGWNLTDYKMNIGIKYYNDSKNNVKDTNTPTYNEFMKFKIQDKYTATDYDTLIKFIKKNDDCYFLFDIGGNNDATNKKILDNIIKNTSKSLLKRIIIDVYDKDMLEIVSKYNFKLINMRFNRNYYSDLDEFIKLCDDYKVISVSSTLSGFNKDEIEKLNNNGFITIVRDINVESEKDLLNSWNVDLIGTDILR